MSTHECPGGACTRQVAADRVACHDCRFKLPKALRSEVWEAYRDRAGEDGHRRHHDALMRAVEWYAENT